MGAMTPEEADAALSKAARDLQLAYEHLWSSWHGRLAAGADLDRLASRFGVTRRRRWLGMRLETDASLRCRVLAAIHPGARK